MNKETQSTYSIPAIMEDNLLVVNNVEKEREMKNINLFALCNIRLACLTIVVGLYLVCASAAAQADSYACYETSYGAADFGVVDLSTGVTTPVGSLGSNIGYDGAGFNNGLATFNGRLYTINNSYGFYGQLYSVNTSNGAVTAVGSPSGIFYDALGSTTSGLFAVGAPAGVLTPALYSINPSTGAATLIASFTIPSGLPGGPSLSTNSNSLYMAFGGGNPYFYQINTSSGQLSLISASLCVTNDTQQCNGMNEMVEENGILYGSDMNNKLFTIDTTTGVVSPSGNSVTNITGEVYGLAPCTLPLIQGVWQSIPGAIISSPTLAWNPVTSKIQMVARGSGNTIWSATFNSSGTFNNDWAQIPGTIISPPALAWNSSINKLQMVVQGSGNTIWSSTFNSSGAFNNDWTQIPGVIISPPALVWNSSSNDTQLVVQGSGNTIWSSTFNSSGTFNNNWTQIPGAIVSPPALVWNSSSNEAQMVVRGSGNTIWSSTFNSSGTFNNDWNQISGAVISSPALAWNTANNNIQMVVQGSGNTIWSATFNSTGFFTGDWLQLTGTIIDQPAIVWNPVQEIF